MRNKMRLKMIAFTVAAAFFTMFAAADVDAAVESYNIADGKVYINGNGAYERTGTTSKNYIVVENGNPTIKIKDLKIDLCDENDDGDSVEAAAICIEKGCNVTLVVEGDNDLYGGNHTGAGDNWGYAAINIESGASLLIQGHEGNTLTVHGGGDYGGAQEGGAGIGSDANNDMGSLTIDGELTINATGAVRAAGIGSGNDTVAGDIVIDDGNITAKGGKYAAGIGCGNAVGLGDGGTCGSITINGGDIKAYGGEQSAGIGGSDEGDVKGTIKITGGTVYAQGGSQGAGIGGGEEGYTNAIEITGGDITAKGGKWAAGIGGGNAVAEGDGGDIGSIKITGGTIEAAAGGEEGEGGAGIGGSDGGEVDSLKIEEDKYASLSINAKGGKWGAGIGSAAEGATIHDISAIYIMLNGGTITAEGGKQGAGIGGGNTEAKKIEIYGEGTIAATGVDKSCAIGAGECEDGGEIIIKGDYGADSYSEVDTADRALNITATTKGSSGAAIIGAADAGGEDISITNAKIVLRDETSQGDQTSAGIGNAVNHEMLQADMGSIVIDNCYITDITGPTREGASIGAGFDSEIDNITINMTYFDGGAIGSTNNSSDVFKETGVDSITIEKSKIHADSSKGMKAAIGSGEYCAVDKITIKDSEVIASSKSGAGIGSGGYESDSQGDALKWTGCACGDITITGSTVTATGADGGAGIGGGWGNSAGDIKIENSTVNASSVSERSKEQGGAGIGGGFAESVGDITIKKSDVTAAGGNYSTGLGSSGADTSATTTWNTTCNSIKIESSTVTASGGSGAAAIGTGYGAQFGRDAGIIIDDCTVTATGGYHGAGIGAGSDGWAGAGGEASIHINIWGKSRIKATGGEGAAGIGGGYDGGANNIYISLDETVYDKNSTDDIKWKYYVYATGGKGAAGIGSGGVNQKDSVLTASGHSVDKVSISGGYVMAQGGGDDYGSGAGIGGGAHGGNLDKLVVTGGYIEANAGDADKSSYTANDIGCGRNDVMIKKDGDVSITGGTILGELSDEFDMVIHGGSVRYNTDKAVRYDETTKAYRTIMQTGEAHHKLQGLQTSLSNYATKDVFSDENGKVYLYLTTSGDDKSTADYSHDGESRHYYGTTDTDGNGWIKMDSVICFKVPDNEHIAGEAFELELDDHMLPQGTKVDFTLTGENIEILDDGTVTIAPGAKVKLLASDRTEYTIHAKTDKTEFDSEMYWKAEGSYSEKIVHKAGNIEITGSPTKVYDGETVEDPAIEYESDAAAEDIEYKYYSYDPDAQKTIGYLGEGVRPADAGTYAVEAVLPATDKYTEALSELTVFTIEKRPIIIELAAEEDGQAVELTAIVLGAVNDPGKVSITIDGIDRGTVDVKASADGGSVFSGTRTFDDVAGDTSYTVKAEYDDLQNYTCINDPVEKTFHKNKVQRTLEVNDLSIVYGGTGWNDGGVLTAAPSESSSSDSYTFEVVYDEFREIYGIEAAAEVRQSGDGKTADIVYRNAGKMIVKVTVEDTGGVYEDAAAYSEITISRSNMTVTSYAYDKTTGNKLSEVTYGSIAETLEYGLEYEGMIAGELPEDAFHGTMEAVPPAETTPVGDAVIEIIKKGKPVTINGTAHGNVFFSRNYDIELKNGMIAVSPAPIYISADDVTAVYGIKPEYKYSFGDDQGNYGLMPWDSGEDVVVSVGLKSGKSYTDYSPGVYEGAVTVTIRDDVVNYDFTSEDGSSTIKAGTLTVTKGNLMMEADIRSKIYDGARVSPEISVEPVTSEGILSEALELAGEPKVTYYEVSEDGVREKLLSAPKDAGNYIAVITVAENSDFYNPIRSEDSFTIRKAHMDVEAPQVPDIKMSEGLVLSDQQLPAGWEWLHPDRELEVGYVNGYAVYTPEDEKNYFKEIRTVGFTVYEEQIAPEGPDDDSDGTENDPEDDSDGTEYDPDEELDENVTDTGDDSNMLIWSVVAILMLVIIAVILVTGKRKKDK